jgi:regulator of sigma E protease
MSLIEILRYLQVAIGIGLVIFVHEAGHFIAARLCKVDVEVFSLGFGPKLFGWRRRGTLYQLALVPLGGYVKMTGEEPGGGPPRPGDLRSKSVGQRFFIFSGGVLMNVAFGLVVFPILLSIGVPFVQPVIGRAEPGGPAWHARIPPGTRVLEVNGNRVVDFSFILPEIALGDPDRAHLVVLEPGASAPREVDLDPRYDEVMGLNSIDVGPAHDPDGQLEVAPDSPAARAGLHSGDELMAVERVPPHLPLPDQLGAAFNGGGPITLRIRREGEPLEVTVTPERVKAGPPVLGVSPPYHHLVDLRPNPDAARLGLERGDRIVSVEGRALLDPYDLELALASAEGEIEFAVLRSGRRMALEIPPIPPERALALASDLALRSDVESTRVVVAPGSAAEAAGLRTLDRVVAIDGAPIAAWKDLRARTEEAARGARALRLDVERPGPEGPEGIERLSLSVQPAPREVPTYGFRLEEASYIYQAASPWEAVSVGVHSSWKFIADAWLTVKRILLGQVSGENLGGIITIGAVSYNWASVGIVKLLFFLCILSLNLAFLNVLPIPVLDGGHLFFLLVEKVKGSPVSERVLGYSQMVGLVLILSLMVYVTYNDLMRWVFRE